MTGLGEAQRVIMSVTHTQSYKQLRKTEKNKRKWERREVLEHKILRIDW